MAVVDLASAGKTKKMESGRGRKAVAETESGSADVVSLAGAMIGDEGLDESEIDALLAETDDEEAVLDLLDAPADLDAPDDALLPEIAEEEGESQDTDDSISPDGLRDSVEAIIARLDASMTDEDRAAHGALLQEEDDGDLLDEDIYIKEYDEIPLANVCDEAEEAADTPLSTAMGGGSPDALLASVQDHSAAIVTLMAQYQEAEREKVEAAIQAERDAAQMELFGLQAKYQSEVADLNYALDHHTARADAAEAELDALKADGQDVLVQLSQALEQVRKYTGLAAVLRKDAEAVKADLAVAKQDAERMDEQLVLERLRIKDLEERILDMQRQVAQEHDQVLARQSEATALRDLIEGGSDNPLVSQLAKVGGELVLYPVQVTAVLDCALPAIAGQDVGAGVVMDVRLVAAMPPDGKPMKDNVPKAIGLARSLFPTAPLTLVLGDDVHVDAHLAGDQDVTIVRVDRDDSRRKAARVLSGAASHLRRSAVE